VPAVQLRPVGDEETQDAARALITEYLRWIAHEAAERYGLSFDIDAMVTSDLEDREKFYPPRGRFYVVRHAERYVGVGCLKALAPRIAEIQRMYLQPEARGLGAGRLLVERLLADAREIGYDTVRLESLKFLSPAHTLYRSVGFVEITPYADNSMKKYQAADAEDRYRDSVVFMEARLVP
jgi:GNAT superfamily N-acetyltransferase